MKQLYVCSKPILQNGKLHRHLIGILSLTDNGFQFEYRLDDSVASDGLMLPFFPDKKRIYNDAETRVLLEDYFPSETDTTFMAEILKKLNQTEYNEWEWLSALDSDDAEAETRLYEQLPDEIIRHDNPVNLNKNHTCKSSDQDNDCDIDESPKYDDSEDEDNFFDFDFNMPDIDDNTEVVDFYVNFDDSDFASIDRLLEEDEERQQSANTETTPAVELKTPEEIPENTQEHKPGVTIIQTVVHKRKKVIKPGDFIVAPPESPMESIQKKLLENEKIRKQKLAEQLKVNPYKITD